MSFLLLRSDEEALHNRLIASGFSLLRQNSRATVDDPITTEMPNFDIASHSETFVYWAQHLGPIEVVGSATAPTSAAAAVRLQLLQDAYGADYRKMIDYERTPILRWRRPYLRAPEVMTPGLLQGMSIQTKDQPQELSKIHARIKRWLKKEGRKINPFDYCTNPAVPQPQNLNMFWCWVHPEGRRWINSDGEVWPWTA